MATIKEYVDFKIRDLFKKFLWTLEDMAHEHGESLAKLADALPGSVDAINQADWLTEEKLRYLRKRVLDSGNETIRSLDSVLSALDAEIILKVKGYEAKDTIHV